MGFLWLGMMAKNTMCYLDKFTVHPDYTGRGVGNQLAHFAIQAAHKVGCRKTFGVIKQDKYHDKSAMNALKVAIGATEGSYTFVCADIDMMISELKEL